MARGATRRPSIGRRIKDTKDKQSQLFSLFRRSDTPSGIQPAFVGGGSGNTTEGGSSSEFLPVAGGTMIGPIAFFPKLVTIATGVIDIGKLTDNFSSRIIVTPESGSTDDLVTIDNAEHAGQLLFLQGVQTDTITLKTTGNIETIDGNDFNIVDDDIIILQFDVTDNKWQQVTTGKSGVGTTIPVGTAENDHLEWDNTGLKWDALQTLQFNATGPHASVGDIKFNNNTINLAWRNAANTGDIELKVDGADQLDLTNNANVAAGVSIRTQHASDPDNSLGLSIGSGASATGLIDNSTALLAIGIGGANRLLFDVITNTAMNLRSPSASAIFSLTSEHATDPDNVMSMSVASGASTDALFDITGAVLKIGAGGATRLTLDVATITQMTLRSPSSQSLFEVLSEHATDPDNTLGMTVTSGAGTDALFEASGDVLKIGTSGFTRMTFGLTAIDLSIALGMNGNDLILDTDDDSKFVTSVDDVLTLNLGASPKFIWTTTSWDITDKFQNMSEITIPSNPGTNAGRFYAKDTGGKTHPFWLESDGEEHDLTLGEGVGGGGSKTFTKVVKTADETVNNSTTLQDDDELRFTGRANKSYAFNLTLLINNSSSTPNFKNAFTLPSGAAGEWTTSSFTSSTAGLTQDVTTSDTHTVASSTPPRHIIYEGVIRMSATAGVVQLQWAQDVATVADTKVLIGSKLIVWEEGTDPTADTGNSFLHTKVVKTVDETVNNTTTLQNDDELFFTGTANKTYFLTLDLFLTSSTVADINMEFSLPSGATGVWTNDLFNSDLPGDTVDITVGDDYATDGNIEHLILHGKIDMGGTTGINNFEWAQQTAEATDSKILKGSSLLVYEEGTNTVSNPFNTGLFRMFFEQRGTSTSTDDTISAPLILATWQIIPPSGITEENDIRTQDGTIMAFMRRTSGSNTGAIAFLESTDNATWTDVTNISTTDASFTKKLSALFNTDRDSSERFIALAMYSNSTPNTFEAKEIKFSVDVILPPAYDFIQIV